MKMYAGTYSDETIIRKLKEDGSSLIDDHSVPFEKRYDKNNKRIILSDEKIKSDVINAGKISWGITLFFAKDHNEALKQAKQMGLKNFSAISNRVYNEGVDY